MGDVVSHRLHPKSVGIIYGEWSHETTWICDVYWLAHPDLSAEYGPFLSVHGKYLRKFKPWPGFYKMHLTDK